MVEGDYGTQSHAAKPYSFSQVSVFVNTTCLKRTIPYPRKTKELIVGVFEIKNAYGMIILDQKDFTREYSQFFVMQIML